MAVILFIGGAIGVELIGGRYAELNGPKNLMYSMIVAIEESLEMGGLIVFIWALLRYCADNYKEVRFWFGAWHDTWRAPLFVPLLMLVQVDKIW